MTDKEKIIVDGKGCRYKTWDKDCALTGDNHGDNMKPCKFIDEKDCYYKQSKRKEQECKNLNKRVSSLEEIADDLQQRNHHLTQECENLKAEEKYLKQCCQKAGEELAKHSFEYDGKEKNLVVQAMELNEKYEKLEKALEEIEEYTKNFSEVDLFKDIKDIINKAKGKEMNKEIIIDGVDVSQCPKYTTNEEFYLEKAKGRDLCLNCVGVKCDYKKYALRSQIFFNYNYKDDFYYLYTLTKNKQLDISKFDVVKLKKEKIFLIAISPVNEPTKCISYKWQDNSITWEAEADEFRVVILGLL